MRSRPDIVEVVVTRNASPGGVIEASVVLKSLSDTPVNTITLGLKGTERFRHASNQAPAIVRAIFDLRATLMERGTLSEGTHTFRARFEIPKDATPSFTGTNVIVDYVMRLHVDIPWWPDRLRDYAITVGPVVHSRPARQPVAQTTARSPDEPFIELLLDDTVLAPGDTLSGVLALGNLRGRKVKGIRMALVTIERRTGSAGLRGVEYPVHFAPDAIREGREFPFRFTLDASLQPAILSRALSVNYALEVRAELAWNKDLVHGVNITLAAMDRPQEGIRGRPRLGTARWRQSWEEAGAEFGLSLADTDTLKLSGRVHNSDVSVFMDPDSDTPSFAAQFEYTSWELALHIKLRTLSILASDPDGDGFGRRYKVEGRDPAQIRPLMTRPFRKALLAFDRVYMDDRQTRVRSRAPGFAEPHIGAFVRHVVSLAREILDASTRIPPPSAMVLMLSSWQTLAEELRANLCIGSMCLRGGSLDGALFDIDTKFDDGAVPARTVLALLPDPPLPEGLDLESPAMWANALPGTHELMMEVKRDALHLRVSPHAMEVEMEAPLGDPGSLRPKMELMLTLARRLRGEKGAGPYR